ncbi:MAG: hypothetical protein F6K19_13845 [Cyanothece sp. SIO1E1]|nr:hypothetical protein [Cyanothece sp. SIO1E1]
MSQSLINKTESKDLTQAIQTAVNDARLTCQDSGNNSGECSAAWDMVEEMRAAASHQSARMTTFFDQYCDEHPSASQCLIYEV